MYSQSKHLSQNIYSTIKETAECVSYDNTASEHLTAVKIPNITHQTTEPDYGYTDAEQISQYSHIDDGAQRKTSGDNSR